LTSFRILGPIEVWSGDCRLAVGGRRQLGVLAFLVLHANTAVPSDEISDALWGPQKGADNRLAMAIGRLRKQMLERHRRENGFAPWVSPGPHS
jgi:DNA-binding SARP family transcriptional activator